MAWIPIAKTVPQYVDSDGDPASGFVIKAYKAGTTTNIPLATSSTGGTTATSMALNASGYPIVSSNIVLPHIDQDFKLALYPTQTAADANSGATWTIDNITAGAGATDEWEESGLTPTFINSTSFSLSGDQTTEFHVGRRLEITDSGGTDYATILTSAFSSVTTITVSVDGGGSIDSGISAVSYAILSATNPSVPPFWNQRQSLKKGADISSATTLTLGTDGNAFDVTGTTTITGIATSGHIGTVATLQFDGALTFTHHATDLILPGGANITTAAGDIAVMYEYASADWRCISYTKKSGLSIAGGKVLQVVTGTTNTQVDVSSTSFSDTGLTASITPSATTSKVLVLVSQALSHNGRATGQLKILRAATSIFNHIDVGDNDNQRSYHFIPFLDSPSSTSSLAYKTQMARHDQSGTINIQRADDGETTRSTIVLVEIGA